MEDLAHSLAEHLALSLIVRDRTGAATLWNPEAQRLYGWSPAEALGRDVDTLLRSRPSEDAETIERKLLRDRRWAGDVYRRTKDGREIAVSVIRTIAISEQNEVVVETSSERLIDGSDDGETQRLGSLFRAMSGSCWQLDVGPALQMLDALADSGITDLAMHVEDHPDMSDRAIEAVRIVEVDDAGVEMFRAPSRVAVLDSNCKWAWPISSRGIFAAALVAAWRGDPAFTAHVALTRWDGAPLDVLLTALPQDGDRKRRIALFGYVDVTGLKQTQRDLEKSDERYRRLFQAMAAGYVEFDFAGVDAEFERLRLDGVTDLNVHFAHDPGSLRQMLGTIRMLALSDKATEILHGRVAVEGGAFRTAMIPSGDEGPMRDVLAARFRGEPVAPFEIAVSGMDGERIDVVFAIWAGQSSRSNEPVLASIIDIGDRRRAELALHQVRSDFAHAARVAMLGEMTASIAHEVNQPLAALSTYGQTILRWINRPVPDLDEVRALAEYVVADAERASAIIARIRSMTVKGAPRSEPLSLNEVVLEAIEIVRNDLAKGGVEPRIALTDALPTFQGDRVQIQQVLVNLIINAVQAMANTPRAERLIFITTSLVPPGRLEVIVEDTGPGVPADSRDHLFTSFFSTKENGMGIGLPICRSILDAHDGEIELLESDRGARLRVCLPITPS
ncbi:PAS domain-containing sensor histidine kinase [Sphingomonas glacialis]|uniref:PAS domain-containing sensor histidine kinase n=1 Tax=Sphingomonas glacialis TaxID=658225 RepID=UPI001386FCE3|nr:ATP-binding protein [Sphingomonas glacialis]